MPVLRLSVVTFPQSSKAWSARALEHDVATTSRSAEGALDALLKIVRAHAATTACHPTAARRALWKPRAISA